MFKQGLYAIVPPLTRVQFIVALLWALGVLLVSIGLYCAQPGDSGGLVLPPMTSQASEALWTVSAR